MAEAATAEAAMVVVDMAEAATAEEATAEEATVEAAMVVVDMAEEAMAVDMVEDTENNVQKNSCCGKICNCI